MAEAVALAASITAMVQIADRIATVCKFFIDTVKDYPKDLRNCYVEIQSLKVIFEGIRFLRASDSSDLATIRLLHGNNGPVECCKRLMDELDKVFPPLPTTSDSDPQRKGDRLKRCLNQLAWPLRANNAMKLLDDISRHKSTISMALQGQIITDVREVRRQVDGISKMLSGSEKNELADWISGSSTLGTPHDIHNLSLDRYVKPTGDWVCRTPEWTGWINGNTRAIWIYGIPGAGKTILASHLIQTTLRHCTERERTTCVYYYCYHGHERDESTPFVRWLVSELLRELDKVPEATCKAYRHRRLEPDADGCLEILGNIIDNFDRVYVVIDALDESLDRKRILNLLGTLLDDVRFSRIQLLATSREYQQIKVHMESISMPLSMSNPFVDADIQVYVKEELSNRDEFRNLPGRLRDEVEKALTTGAKGMFRWAECQLDLLRRLNTADILEKIKCLPETVEKTYEAIFKSIAPWEQDLVRHALHWVSFHDFLWQGSEQLYSDVLLDFCIARASPTDGCDAYTEPYDLDLLKDACGCLVTFFQHCDKRLVYNHTGEVSKIAHYTVREFLESDRAPDEMRINEERYREILRSVFELAIELEDVSELHDYPDFDSQASIESSEPGDTLDDFATYNIPDDQEGFESRINCRLTDLREYCLASSFLSLSKNENMVEPGLAFQLLDPRQDVYNDFARALARQETDYESLGVGCLKKYIKRFNNISNDSGNILLNAAILASLLTIGSVTLASVLVQGSNMEELAREPLYGETIHCNYHSRTNLRNQFNGGLVTVLCQVQRMNMRTLNFLQTEAPTLQYSEILPWYMMGHSCGPFADASHDDDCALPQLIELGAMPDPDGFRVTPLQIAVYARDILGVRDLLRAGADANNTGQPDGLAWEDKRSVLYPYNKLHGVRPLDILSRFSPKVNCDKNIADPHGIEILNGRVTSEIRRLLLSANERPNKTWLEVVLGKSE